MAEHDNLIDPSTDDLQDPMFEAIWQAIKGWDIGRDGGGGSYAGATGTDVMTVLSAVRAALAAPAQDVAPTDAQPVAYGLRRDGKLLTPLFNEREHAVQWASDFACEVVDLFEGAAAQPAAQPADALDALWWTAGALAASPMAQDDTICMDGVTRSVSAILDAASAVLAARTQDNAS